MWCNGLTYAPSLLYLISMKCLNKNCNKEHNGLFGSGKYCSRQCANSRILTADVKNKISKSMSIFCLDNKNPNFKKKPINGNYIILNRICNYCKNNFQSKKKKYCSEICKNNSLSEIMSKRLKNQLNRYNYGRGKKSYLEKSFEEWLNKYNIKFETEKKFFNKETKKNYFVDFIFEDKKLIIELDGTQHLKTIQKDKERDDYIEKNYGYKIIRISYKEYQNKSKEQLIKNALFV